jgi:putative phage-type endonuclease
VRQGTQEWHQARAGKLTGSHFAAALGMSPYCTRQKLYRILTGREEPDAENAAMQWGTRNEPNAISWYENETGEIVEPVGFVPHSTFPWCGVSPDGYVGKGRIEVKCPVSGIAHETIPVHYVPQCYGVLHITGGEWLDFISWTPNGANVFRVTAEESREQWQAWEARLAEFWSEYILKDVCPPRRKNVTTV